MKKYKELEIKNLKKNLYKEGPKEQPLEYLDDEEIDFDPNLGLAMTRKRALRILAITVIVAFIAVFGFLIYKEYTKKAVDSGYSVKQEAPPDYQNYNNEFWGFRFKFPGSWVIMNAENNMGQGEYYFASTPIDFVQELEPDQAILEVKAYNNIQNSGFEEWLTKQEQTYYNPEEIISKRPDSFRNRPAKHYMIIKKGGNANARHVDMLIIFKDNKTFLEMMLLTSSEDIHDKYKPIFDKIINSMDFYQGYSNAQ